MSLKFSSNWKKHYLTHSSDDEKPHKCQWCGKAFITATSLRNHTQKKHKDKEMDSNPTVVKTETFSGGVGEYGYGSGGGYMKYEN